MVLLSLLMILVCSFLNHLGGQNTDVPNPRISFRVIAMPAYILLTAWLCGAPTEQLPALAAVLFGGFALWAVFKWGPMFMVFNGEDHRDYTTKWYQTNTYITPLCDFLMGFSELTKITSAEAREWGLIYGTIRGAFMLPMFIALAFMLTSWAIPVGGFCVFQGCIYRTSSDVFHAEYKFGALIGLMFSIIFLISF